MKILQASDYIIYFDDVRMDPYIKNWSASCGLRASDATANITMYRTKALENWKGYLTQVRIFPKNVFSAKFSIVFEGEIMNRNFSESRNDSGEITFNCKGFYHWLDVPIPLMIGNEEELDYIQRFRYEAQNINVQEVSELFSTREEITMKNKPIKEMIETLFKRMNSGYYLYDDSTFAWANLQKRFKVMGEVINEFREAGYLDAFTFVRGTQIETFYVYLTQVLTQMMFEFYQDRDGVFRIKTPSWSDNIPKAHILDEAIIDRTAGYDDWENEPTRVLVIGGHEDVARSGAGVVGAGNIVTIPMGLYIGKPGEGEFYQQNVELMMQQYGVNPDDFSGGAGNFYDDLTERFKVTSPFGVDRGTHMHMGTDFGMRYEILNSQGVSGVVKEVQYNAGSMGNMFTITQNIGGQDYDFVYMHMSKIDVKVGDNVAPGQKIGTTGNTGRSTGPHLHYEIWKGGRRESGAEALDPMKFVKKMKSEATYGGGSVATGSGDVAKFMNQDLKNQSKLTAEQLNNWINSKTKQHSVMRNQGNAFFKAGQDSGLDPLYIVAHAAHETAWGTSGIVKRKNNFYGIRAFDDSPSQSASTWGSPADGIIKGAVWIRKNYYDKGQNTLYKMRFSSNGKHNYATDKLWPNKIAEIMISAKLAKPGQAAPAGGGGGGGGSSSSASSVSPNTYFGTPYASTGGFAISTKISSNKTKQPYEVVKDIKDSLDNKEKVVEGEVTPVDYRDFSKVARFKFIIPFEGKGFESYIRKEPNGVNANMICLIIQALSKWKAKSKTSDHVGLMGLNEDYINDVLAGDEASMYDGEKNIQHSTLFISNAYERFSDKMTFALAAFYEGNMKNIEEYIEKAGVEDYSKVREHIPKATNFFVDNIIDQFCDMFDADYLKGDPHITIQSDRGFGKVTEDGLAEDTEVKEYESAYKPVMSDEERLYKVNLKVSEQLLIRYDTVSEEGNLMDADELVERYSKYMMQLYRAESHQLSVPLGTCMPSIRPGFNAWVEPTRRDVVMYVTRVQHNGSFQQGAYTTVTGEFVRDPKSYDDIEENIFVGETSVTAEDFGEVVKKPDMDKMRDSLKKLHESDEVIGDARNVPTLSKLYSSSKGKQNGFETRWNGEFTEAELKKKMEELYKEAPDVVKERKKNLKEIVTKSKDFFKKMLLQTNY